MFASGIDAALEARSEVFDNILTHCKRNILYFDADSVFQCFHRLWATSIHPIFEVAPQKKITRIKVWRVRRPKDVAPLRKESVWEHLFKLCD